LSGVGSTKHAFHTWDVEVARHPAATIPAEATAVVVDNLGLVARFTAQPTGDTTTITVRTTDPARDFTIELTPEGTTLASGSAASTPDPELPAEAFVRLFGRLDPDHTPAVKGDDAIVEARRRTFPGP